MKSKAQFQPLMAGGDSGDRPCLTVSQIRRLLAAIVRLPQGPRRDRFFRFLMRSNAPAVILELCGPDLWAFDQGCLH